MAADLLFFIGMLFFLMEDFGCVAKNLARQKLNKSLLCPLYELICMKILPSGHLMTKASLSLQHAHMINSNYKFKHYLFATQFSRQNSFTRLQLDM